MSIGSIPNKIVIGNDQDNPLFVFENDHIKQVESDSSVSLVGEELFIDQLTAIVDYYVWVPYVFKPTDYSGFMSSDSLILCTKRNYDIRTLPYGTKIVYYAGQSIAGIFYSKTVERVGMAKYKINAVSAIGLLNKQYHKGGLYIGADTKSFAELMDDILGNDYDYLVDGVVAIQRVGGWLPYDTKRNNLYRLLLAYGVEIVVGDNGGMFFTFPDASVPEQIPLNRVFTGGKVVYDEPASRIEISEHSYHYDGTVDEVTLFDNSSDATVENAFVKFEQPIEPSTIRCSSGSLTISTAHTNYAVVSGSGVLRGKPYVHNLRLITKDNERALTEKVVTVEDCTVITFLNADNVLERLSEYYFNATRVDQDINVLYEKVGKLYTTNNAFHELITGFITRMTKSVTSIARAQCRFLQNYVPTGAGQAYTERLLVPLGQNETYTWTIPAEVFAKEKPNIRVTLIGKGQNGTNGGHGAKGKSSSANTGRGKGGAGGAAGKGGLGGNVLIITIDATDFTQISFANSGNNSTLHASGSGGMSLDYSSANGAPNNYGYFDILTGELYAMPGVDGMRGGNGGDGDYYTHTTGEGSGATNGEDVTYNGVTYKGGNRSNRAIISGSSVGISGNLTLYFSAAGGGGAAVGRNGANAVTYYAASGFGNSGPGAGANAIAPAAAVGYGTGGNGGHGGGGGGAGVNCEYWNHVYSSIIGNDSYFSAEGGAGSAGGAGNYGCAIIYW